MCPLSVPVREGDEGEYRKWPVVRSRVRIWESLEEMMAWLGRKGWEGISIWFVKAEGAVVMCPLVMGEAFKTSVQPRRDL